ncbi:MAG: hypothetical protein AAGD92_00130 [Pseudomonadota bacterium]
MADRLKDIWSGFSATTDRRLTGKGVENIIVPHRSDYDAVDRQFLPENFESPAERAFAALRADLSAKEKKINRKRTKEVSAEAAAEPVAEDEDIRNWGRDDLNMGLWSTAMRVERSDLDYRQFMSSDAGKAALKRTKKKKRFGLF